MRGAAPSVVCPRCGNESPPSGAGRFMTCAKCGMSIDVHAGERQEAVRGRVKEKPEIEIDPSLPMRPSKFPFGAAMIALLVLVSIPFVYYFVTQDGLTDEQRENIRVTRIKQQAFGELYASMRSAHSEPECEKLLEIVVKPCLSTVDASKLDFDSAAYTLAALTPSTCQTAADAFAKARVEAKCDRPPAGR